MCASAYCEEWSTVRACSLRQTTSIARQLLGKHASHLLWTQIHYLYVGGLFIGSTLARIACQERIQQVFVDCLPLSGTVRNKDKPDKKEDLGRYQWLTPIILATQEALIWRTAVQSQPGQIVLKTLSQKKKKNHQKMAGRVAQMVRVIA
jgi:hypothetical protein